MNTPNNRRRQNTLLKIHTAFLSLLQDHELNDITVTDICSLAEINRTTFYANYQDIHALANAVMDKLEVETIALVGDGLFGLDFDGGLLKLFTHIRENQNQYKTYFKFGFDGRFLIPENAVAKSSTYHQNAYGKYHIEFFRHGLTAVVKMWLEDGCVETPEEIVSIIRSEYTAQK